MYRPKRSKIVKIGDSKDASYREFLKLQFDYKKERLESNINVLLKIIDNGRI